MAHEKVVLSDIHQCTVVTGGKETNRSDDRTGIVLQLIGLQIKSVTVEM